jgi:hypothetical protein
MSRSGRNARRLYEASFGARWRWVVKRVERRPLLTCSNWCSIIVPVVVSTVPSSTSGNVVSARRRRATIEQLRAELATKQVSTTVPMAPAFARLLAGPGLRKGAVYAVADEATAGSTSSVTGRTGGSAASGMAGYGTGRSSSSATGRRPGSVATPELAAGASTSLLLGLLAGPSQAGLWCGVAGLPGLGIEAAAGYGIDLRRLVLVPSPGPRWLEVVGALVDVLDVIVVHPPGPAPDAQTRRLAARLRERGAVLIVSGAAGRTGGARGERNLAWPGCEVQFAVTSSRWSGLGEGHGHLTERRVTVEATGRGVGWRTRTADLLLPASDGGLGHTEETAPVVPLTRDFAEREQKAS